MSASAGIPTWPQLVESLATAAREKLSSLGSEEGGFLATKLRAADSASSPWDRMQILREALGEATFSGAIRRELGRADTLNPPENYRRIWNLGVRGVLTLNLDKFATRAFTLSFPEKAFSECCGCNIDQYLTILQSPLPFVVNVHGETANASSWVLTSRDLSALLANEGYRRFIASCIHTRSIVFLGVSADDPAIARHFEFLKELRLGAGEHFWITDRRTQAVDRWAESVGLQPIYYSSSAGDHTEFDEIVRDLQRFVPEEPEAPPAFESPLEADLPVVAPASTWKNLSTDELRIQLNAGAEAILRPGTPEAYQVYEQFVADHEELIHRACFVPARPRKYRLLGFELLELIGEGAFGSVYRATSRDGTCVALKVLHDKVRRNREMLQSFRRGVRSMQILARRSVSGMVPYLRASEIPPFVVMEFVPGCNLQQAVEARHLEDWSDILRIAFELACILRQAHSLPERVLHRDLRPPNILLKDFYDPNADWSMVVLDFDLSWHLDAMEVSITSAHSATGYLAPEQLVETPGVSRRSAAVDSFGLGMTIFFLLARRAPRPGEHAQSDWVTTLRSLAKARPCASWRSAPARISRLVMAATRDRQSERPDMHAIAGELERIRDAVGHPDNVGSAELVAEEFLCRLRGEDAYSWINERASGGCRLASGAEVRMKADEGRRSVTLSIEWESAGQESRKKVGKYLPDAEARSVAILRRKGWQVVSTRATRGAGLAISAEQRADSIRDGLDGQVEACLEVCGLFSF